MNRFNKELNKHINAINRYHTTALVLNSFDFQNKTDINQDTIIKITEELLSSSSSELNAVNSLVNELIKYLTKEREGLL